MTYALTTLLPLAFDDTVTHVRDALAEQGFGVLTEIDVKATMKTKLDADIENYLILGACNPPLALQALGHDRSVGLLLPCNVVVRSVDGDHTLVEFLDPKVMAQVSSADGMADVAEQAGARLRTALVALAGIAATS